MKPNCERERITHKAFKNIIKSWPKNSKEMEEKFVDLLYNNKPVYLNLSR